MTSADDLLMLLEVARSGTFAAAGATLGIEHTTVSRRIGALERSLGNPVVVRSARGCTLTELGRSLLEGAERIERTMESVAELAAAPGPLTAQLSGLVRIAAPEGFGAAFVAPTVARVHRRHPGVDIELVTATRPLVQGVGADIEIGVGQPTSRRINSFVLAPYTIGIYASLDYLATRGRPTTRAELAGHTVIYYIDSLLRVDDLNLIDRVFPNPVVHLSSTSVHAQLQMTLAGGGIGILPNFLAAPQTRLTRLLPSEVDVELVFTAVLAPRVLRRPAANEVLRELRAELASRVGELRPAI